MNTWSIHLLSGLEDGLLRALVGLTKSKAFQEKQWKFETFYFSVSVVTAALFGIASGLLVDESWKLSFLAGYAGSDFLESLYKLRFAQFFKVG